MKAPQQVRDLPGREGAELKEEAKNRLMPLRIRGESGYSPPTLGASSTSRSPRAY